jgi:acyl carrier protein
MLIESSDRLT